jgi:hypothetical protein
LRKQQQQQEQQQLHSSYDKTVFGGAVSTTVQYSCALVSGQEIMAGNLHAQPSPDSKPSVDVEMHLQESSRNNSTG